MRGKIALISGGGRGIGAATSKLLAKRGARVVVNFAKDAAAAEKVVQDIREDGGEAIAIQADVCNPDDIGRMFNQVKERWGSPEILVSNANMRFVMASFADMAWDDFSDKLNSELKAAFLITKAVTPGMIEKGYGRIVYIASGLGRHPRPGFIAHGTAKAGLIQFAKYIAQEYGPHGIVANVISPGLVLTDATKFMPEEHIKRTAAMTPIGRVASPEDIAGAIAMYASDDAKFVSGVYVPVNGGAEMD